MTLNDIAKAWRIRKLQLMQDEIDKRDAAQRKANRRARSLPPDDEDERVEAVAKEIMNTAHLVPDVPETKHVFEDLDRISWEWLRAYLVRHEAHQRDVLRAIQKIANNIEKISMEKR